MFQRIVILSTPNGIFYGNGGYSLIPTDYQTLSDAIHGILGNYYSSVDECHTVRIDHCSQRATLVF